MSTITKESAQQIFLGNGPEPTASEERELARIALASLEAEPVALRDERSGSGGISKKPGFNDLQHGTPLYTAPPAPVSVPDERYQHLSELYHAQEKRLFKLAQRIKGASFDKYAYSPSQAIDVLESAIFGEREDECRAAILHGADRPQNEPQNIPENIPATQFEPVADLYGLTSPTGGETSFTFDAVEARDFIDGGWSCQEYVELGRFQEAMLQNGNSPAQSDCCPEQNYIAPAQDGDSPVIPDGWVAVPVEPTYQMCKAMGLPWESPRFPDLYKAMLAAVKK
ncbi:hypothetical protein [Enterobacter hormaechei]|uniref:hypothetical protein n=1 Tax=Enterobacter hormaechei TaxID=158836 RepID=UPI001ABF187A|nr:hypothetical protein [Enterobacter hormaechei]